VNTLRQVEPRADVGGPITLAGEPEPSLPPAASPWADAGLAVAIVLGIGLALLLHIRRRRVAGMPESRRVFLRAAGAAGLGAGDRRALERLSDRSGVPAAALLISDDALRQAALAPGIGRPAPGGSGPGEGGPASGPRREAGSTGGRLRVTA